MQPAVVGIADLRHQAVGPRDGGEKRDHVAHARAIRGRQRRALEVGEARGAEKQLGHEPVVRNGRLVVGAVGQHLHRHLLLERRARERRPLRALRQIGEHGADELQAERRC